MQTMQKWTQKQKNEYLKQQKPMVAHHSAILILNGKEDDVTFLAKKIACEEVNAFLSNLMGVEFKRFEEDNFPDC